MKDFLNHVLTLLGLCRSGNASDHLGEKQAIIIGHDMGGKTAYFMAHLYPQSVAKLVLKVTQSNFNYRLLCTNLDNYT